MKRKILIVLMVIMLLIPSVTLAEKFDYELFNQEFKFLLNEERDSQGLHPLEISTILLDFSNIRSKEMADYGSLRYLTPEGIRVAHIRPDGRQWYTVFLDNKIYNMDTVGENIAQIWTFQTDEIALAGMFFDAWKYSPSHYANMMSENYNYFAVGVGFNEDSVLSTNLLSWFSDKQFINNNPEYKRPSIPVTEKPEEPIVDEPIIDEPVIETPVIEEPVTPPTPPRPTEPVIEKPVENHANCSSERCLYGYDSCPMINALVELVLWGYY